LKVESAGIIRIIVELVDRKVKDGTGLVPSRLGPCHKTRGAFQFLGDDVWSL
jgi:hypothetical protein